MFIVTAENVTHERANAGYYGSPCLAREDGTADYEVWVGINQHLIWRGSINGHTRAAGAAALLRLIADKVEANGEPFSK